MHMIIHDLRNPLTAISASIELTLREKENLSEKQHQRLERSFDDCQELDGMIQSVLDTNKLENGKLAPDEESVTPRELLDGVLSRVRPRAEEKHISLSFSRSGNIPSIQIDRGLIRRVIANLVINAIRHTHRGGRIEVALDCLPQKGGVCFRVSDHGNGVAPEYHQKIFDKFEQVKPMREGVKVGGSGLGLASCKMAVEAHGGKIWVESEGDGKGACFRFLVPA